MRTRTAADGGFTIEAERIGLKPGDIVRLKTQDGREIDVPRGQPSDADREYAQNPPQPGSKPTLVGQRVDLLSLIDLGQHIVNGPWSRVGNRLVGGGVNASRVQIPYEPPPEYDVFVQAQMTKRGNGGLIIGLVSGEQQFFVTVREDGCGISIDGVVGNEFEVKNLRLPVAMLMTFQCRVRRDVIQLMANGNRILEYRGDQSKLRLGPTMTMPNPREVFIGSGGPDIQWSISSIGLVPVAGEQPATATPAPAAAGAAGAANPAPAAIVKFGGHRYSFVEGRVSWTEAKQKCEEMGGYLACITTPAEQAFLVNAAPKADASPAQGKFWIGGFLRDGRWQWLSGERSNFAPNRPAADPSEPYLRLMVNTNRWLGEGENTTLIQGFICEWNK